MKQLPWGNGEEEPLHLLEALHRTTLHFVEEQEPRRESSTTSVDAANRQFRWVTDLKAKGIHFRKSSLHLLKTLHRTILHFAKKQEPRRKSSTKLVDEANSPFRSVTDLKAKGIHFKRSSPCLRDIKFDSFAFYAQFHLPFFHVSGNTIIASSNLIAFEMSPETETDFGVTSYINLMKSLIHTAEDVKVLRERGILYSMLASDEEVVRVFKSIDTYGYCRDDLIYDVKMRIDKHCKNKAKTWIAELINTKFRNPWTITALAAAAFLLCLTFLQTYYTINPRNTST